MTARGEVRCSIIIPAYNAEGFVAAAVRSALAQGPEAEVIVVDDGSTDGTAAAADIEGATVVRRENGGCPAARLTGLERATGEFFVFLDADDELVPGAVAAHCRAMSLHPEAAMVFGSNHRIDERGQRIDTNHQSPFETRDPGRVALSVTPAPSQCMYRRSSFEAVGGYDPKLRLCEDSDINIRITAVGSIVCHGEMVANYRLHGGQSTKRPSRIARAHLGVIRRHLGPDGRFADPQALGRCEAKWKRYYGRNMPMEIARTAFAGDFGGSTSATRTFLSFLPQSAWGAASHLPKLVRRQGGRSAGAARAGSRP